MAGFTHDYMIDLATSLPDTRDTEMEPSTLSWGLDFTFLAVYQQHQPSCYRNLTRYTIKSVKNILLFIEKFKISGESSAFCSCPPHTAKTDSPIFCFTCIQLHCEVKSMFLDSIDKNFSYQNQANGIFTLNAIQSPVDVNLFKAQSLFDPAISITRTLCPKKMIYFNRWDQVKLNQPKVRAFFGNPSLCLICKYPGNGKEVFLCQRCSRTAVV